jgi:hypothetical protein
MKIEDAILLLLKNKRNMVDKEGLNLLENYIFFLKNLSKKKISTNVLIKIELILEELKNIRYTNITIQNNYNSISLAINKKSRKGYYMNLSIVFGCFIGSFLLSLLLLFYPYSLLIGMSPAIIIILSIFFGVFLEGYMKNGECS